MTSRELAGIHHVKIPVTYLARSLHWYRRVFGLRPTLAFPRPTGWSAASPARFRD